MPAPYGCHGDGRANRLAAVEHRGDTLGPRMADLWLYFCAVLMNGFDESTVLVDKAVLAQRHGAMHIGVLYVNGD